MDDDEGEEKGEEEGKRAVRKGVHTCRARFLSIGAVSCFSVKSSTQVDHAAVPFPLPLHLPRASVSCASETTRPTRSLGSSLSAHETMSEAFRRPL